MAQENTNVQTVQTVNLNGKVVRVQLIVQCAVIGSCDLTESQKAEYLTHALRININGTEQTANMRLSQSTGLAASFMVKDNAIVTSAKLINEKGATKGKMKASATASLRAGFEQPEEANI
jgi:hypothetical protein